MQGVVPDLEAKWSVLDESARGPVRVRAGTKWVEFVNRRRVTPDISALREKILSGGNLKHVTLVKFGWSSRQVSAELVTLFPKVQQIMVDSPALANLAHLSGMRYLRVLTIGVKNPKLDLSILGTLHLKELALHFAHRRQVEAVALCRGLRYLGFSGWRETDMTGLRVRDLRDMKMLRGAAANAAGARASEFASAKSGKLFQAHGSRGRGGLVSLG